MTRHCMDYLAVGYDSAENLIDDAIASAARHKCIVRISFKGVGMALGEETDRNFAIKNMKGALVGRESAEAEIEQIVSSLSADYLTTIPEPSAFAKRLGITLEPTR